MAGVFTIVVTVKTWLFRVAHLLYYMVILIIAIVVVIYLSTALCGRFTVNLATEGGCIRYVAEKLDHITF